MEGAKEKNQAILIWKVAKKKLIVKGYLGRMLLRLREWVRMMGGLKRRRQLPPPISIWNCTKKSAKKLLPGKKKCTRT